MTRFRVVLLLLPLLVTLPDVAASATEAQDREALRHMSEDIRAAFARQDIEAILAFHHPDVRKALGFDHLIVGRAALEKDLAATFAQVRLEWIDNQVEDLLIDGDLAVEQTLFVIRATPKAGGAPTQFKGRAQIVYRRYSASPSGWATIREIVQQ